MGLLFEGPTGCLDRCGGGWLRYGYGLASVLPSMCFVEGPMFTVDLYGFAPRCFNALSNRPFFCSVLRFAGGQHEGGRRPGGLADRHPFARCPNRPSFQGGGRICMTCFGFQG